jgi:hypothetical protein
MKFIPLAIALLSGTLHAQDGIRILSADPADNVLLEISTDTPRSVMASNDLENWSPVFHYIPACQNFKAYAPQIERKQTFYKLAPLIPAFAGFVLSPEVPLLAGKSFGNIGWNFSFSGGGLGTCNPIIFESGGPENLTYTIVDSRPGMASVRTLVADGRRRDHLILMTDPAAPEFRDSLVFTADRFGDVVSRMWAGLADEGAAPIVVSHYIGAEIPASPPSWPTPQGMVLRFGSSGEVVTLGDGGVATVEVNGNSEIASYEYIPTGAFRATLSLARSNGTRTTAWIREGDPGEVFHRAPGTEPYSTSGSDTVEILIFPETGE